jgi:hypothetical protein
MEKEKAISRKGAGGAKKRFKLFFAPPASLREILL